MPLLQAKELPLLRLLLRQLLPLPAAAAAAASLVLLLLEHPCVLLLRVAPPPPGLQRGSRLRRISAAPTEGACGEQLLRPRGDPAGAPDPDPDPDPETIPTIPGPPPPRGDCRHSPEKEETHKHPKQTLAAAARRDKCCRVQLSCCVCMYLCFCLLLSPPSLSLSPQPNPPAARRALFAAETPRQEEVLLLLLLPLLLLRAGPEVAVPLRVPLKEMSLSSLNAINPLSPSAAGVLQLAGERPAPAELSPFCSRASVPCASPPAAAAAAALASGASSVVTAAAAAAAAPRDVPQAAELQEKHEGFPAAACGFCCESSLLQQTQQQQTGCT